MQLPIETNYKTDNDASFYSTAINLLPYTIAETIQFVNHTISHPTIADQNDEIEKPGRIHATRAKIIALIILPLNDME